MKKQYILFAFLIAGSYSCTKSGFLDQKPNTSIIIPTSLTDLRSLLNNTSVFTYSPGLGEVSSDNYYLNYTDWQAQAQLESNAYIWAKDLYASASNIADWTIPCQQVLYANIVLSQLPNISPNNRELPEWNDLRASALFLRAYAFTSLVTHFAKAYDSTTADTDPGIPLRLDADTRHLYPRASIKECYERIRQDLQEAVPLFASKAPLTEKNRPCQAAAYGLLSRVCLAARQYTLAGKYADSCLADYATLIDYNTLSTTASSPFDRYTAETIYYCQAVSSYLILQTISTVVAADSTLYQSYAANDLRKLIYFRSISGNRYGIKRGYGGTVYAFTGLTTDEMLLNRAECAARAGNSAAAMGDLNTLLSKRWKTGTFQPYTAANATDALSKVLTERRKELIWRGLRWLDLKRLNLENSATTITRILNGQTYTLPPKSPLYVFPIPDNEISLSGITQNAR